MKIKDKLTAAFFLVTLIICMLSLSVLQISFNRYDRKVYEESANTLNLFSAGIETELKSIEDLSFDIISDGKVQQYLTVLKSGLTEYERYKEANKLYELLQSYSILESYIMSINIIDANDNEITAGIKTVLTLKERKAFINLEAGNKKGKNLWVEPGDKDNLLVCAREIRKIGKLSLEHLGTLIIRIDMEKLTKQFLNVSPKSDINLVILSSKENLIFGNSSLVPGNEAFKNKHGHLVEKIENRKYFIAYTKPSYTNWIYINILPYESIFQEITFMRMLILIIYALVFSMAIAISIKLTRNITRPIEILTTKMKRVENGDFEVEENNGGIYDGMDELGTMHKDFNIMLTKINTLIKDNYEKQIDIKEAEYKALQAQINPHFLYNTLDSINWMARMNKQHTISRMVESLGSLLRSSISQKGHVVTLQEEINILQNYVTIQMIRYEERLDFQIDMDLDLMDYIIPRLTLQPIVENSINYGLEVMLEVCRITVKGVKSGDSIVIKVEDNGPGMEKEFLDKLKQGQIQPKGSGIGLNNINRRIKSVFGEQYGIFIDSEWNKGTVVEIHIPYEMRMSNV